MNRSPARRRLMVLGAGLFQLAGISRALESGCDVVSVDNIPANPGHRLVRESVNISTTDVAAVVELATQRAVDGIVTFASDIATPSVAAAR